ncbi:MAG: hypothetical protein U1E29_06115 [Coriobacteriia bacterium]|nr:hypothetical protein [Coriobacteriia bacterium]
MTRRAARKVKGAALNAHELGFGLVTFMTFTCAPGDRKRVARGELVLGREMRRVLNAMQQRFRREGQSVFVYVWVAENPRNDNPHVHLLTNLRVPRAEFDALAEWIEALWGHGWVKIERIKKSERAGHYILKAVGYSAKGTDGGQGTVRGNRYGISRNIATDETTFDVSDREAAAETLCALTRALPEGQDVEELAEGVYLTRFGLAFGPGTPVKSIGDVIDGLEQGVVPG